MPYNAIIDDNIESIDRVEARISCSPSKGSWIYNWTLTSQGPQQNHEEDVADGKKNKVVTLYTPTMDAAGTENIYDGTSTYYLQAWGAGKWTVKVELYVRIVGQVNFAKLDQASVSADFWYRGAPLPRYKMATMEEEFQEY